MIQRDGPAHPDPAQLNAVLASGAMMPAAASTTRQIAQKAASACETLRAKLEGLVKNAEEGQLARRGGSALYKGLKCASCAVSGMRTALALAHCAFISQLAQMAPLHARAATATSHSTPIPPVVLNRTNSLVERASARITTMEWSLVVDTWSDMCKLFDKYIPLPP